MKAHCPGASSRTAPCRRVHHLLGKAGPFRPLQFRRHAPAEEVGQHDYVTLPRPQGRKGDDLEAQPVERDEEADRKLDELLDEIDQVLEENAEEFVKNYIQKGGE